MTNKKYRLKKDLPGIESGTIFRWYIMTGGYRPENDKKKNYEDAMLGTLPRYWVEGNSDWFELIEEDKSEFVWTDELVLMVVDLAHHNGYHKNKQRVVELFEEVKKQAMGSGYKFAAWITGHIKQRAQNMVTLSEVVAEYKSRTFNQKEFERNLIEAAEFFGRNILCEECGEIGKHKASCSKFTTPTDSAVNKDWIILMCKTDGNNNIHCFTEGVCLGRDEGVIPCKIHSVLRKSDGEVLVVGGTYLSKEINSEIKIEAFKESDGSMYALYLGVWTRIDLLKLKQ